MYPVVEKMETLFHGYGCITPAESISDIHMSTLTNPNLAEPGRIQLVNLPRSLIAAVMNLLYTLLDISLLTLPFICVSDEVCYSDAAVRTHRPTLWVYCLPCIHILMDWLSPSFSWLRQLFLIRKGRRQKHSEWEQE